MSEQVALLYGEPLMACRILRFVDKDSPTMGKDTNDEWADSLRGHGWVRIPPASLAEVWPKEGVTLDGFWNVRVSFKAFRIFSSTMGLRVLGSRWGRRRGIGVVPGVEYG